MARSNINFTGPAVTVTDDAGNDRVNIAVAGSYQSPPVTGTSAQQRTALIAWLDALTATGSPGYLYGNYTISAEIDRTDDNLTIRGAGAAHSSITLDASASQNQRILQFSGSDDLTLTDFALIHNNTAKNAAGYALDLVGQSRRARIQRLDITAASAGIRCEALKDSWITDNYVHDLFGDGIHLDNGPTATFTDNVEVARNVVERTGDDALAVVSYTTVGGNPATGINAKVRFHHNRVKDAGSNGIHFAGAVNCQSDHNLIDGTRNNGWLAQTDGSFGTQACTNVRSDHDEFYRVGADAYASATATHGTTHGVNATVDVVGCTVDHAKVVSPLGRGFVLNAQKQVARGNEVSGAGSNGFECTAATEAVIHGNKSTLAASHGFSLVTLTNATVKNNLSVDSSQASAGTSSNYYCQDIVGGDYAGNESVINDGNALRHHLFAGTNSAYSWGVNPVSPLTKVTILTGSKVLVADDPNVTVEATGGTGTYTMTGIVRLVRVTATSVARTVTLPAAAAVIPGAIYTVVDESNGAGTNNITLARAGFDTWRGGATSKKIRTNGGSISFYSTGAVWVQTVGDGTLVGAPQAVNTVTASGSVLAIPDPAIAQQASYITLTANCTLTFPTAVGGKSLSITLKQDGTGSRLVTWPGAVEWAGGTPPTLSTGVGKVDAFTFTCVDGTTWFGHVIGLDMQQQPVAAPTFVAATTGSAAATTFSMSRPGGTQTDDLLLAFVGTRGGELSPPLPPTGWTLAASVRRSTFGWIAAYYRFDAPAAPGPWTFNGGNGNADPANSGTIITVRGAALTSTIDTWEAVDGASATAQVTPTATTDVVKTLVVRAVTAATATTTVQTFTWEAGATERADVGRAGSASTCTVTVATEPGPVSAGTTGTRTATATAASTFGALTLAITPVGALLGGGGGVTDFARGVNLVDGGGTDAFTITNVARGTYGPYASGGTYNYPSSADFAFLATRGMKHAQVHYMLERVFPTLSGAGNTTELGRLTTVADSALTAGMQVVFQSFNKGQYRTVAGAQTFGTSGYTSANFADAQARLGQAFQAHDGVWGISLQNEPYHFTSVATHESIMQDAVTAMRSGGFTKVIVVPIYLFSTPQRLAYHTHGPWIVDSLNNIAYEIHEYVGASIAPNFDDNKAYSDMVADAVSRGYVAGANTDALHSRLLDEFSWFDAWLARKTPKPRGMVGEWGNPNLALTGSWTAQAGGDQARWNALWERCLTQFDTYGWSAMEWGAGYYGDRYRPYNDGYSPTTMNTPQGNSAPLEAHPSLLP